MTRTDQARVDARTDGQLYATVGRSDVPEAALGKAEPPRQSLARATKIEKRGTADYSKVTDSPHRTRTHSRSGPALPSGREQCGYRRGSSLVESPSLTTLSLAEARWQGERRRRNRVANRDCRPHCESALPGGGARKAWRRITVDRQRIVVCAFSRAPSGHRGVVVAIAKEESGGRPGCVESSVPTLGFASGVSRRHRRWRVPSARTKRRRAFGIAVWGGGSDRRSGPDEKAGHVIPPQMIPRTEYDLAHVGVDARFVAPGRVRATRALGTEVPGSGCARQPRQVTILAQIPPHTRW